MLPGCDERGVKGRWVDEGFSHTGHCLDVNETLLDLSSLDSSFEEALGDPSLRGQWFAQMLQLSFVGGLTGDYLDFTTAQKAAFLMVARRAGVEVSADDAEAMALRMSSLPAYEEVDEALGRLGDTRLTVVALTNSVAAVRRRS